jgi:hypothetical protein
VLDGDRDSERDRAGSLGLVGEEGVLDDECPGRRGGVLLERGS